MVLFTSGDKVPADVRLIQARNLQVNESAQILLDDNPVNWKNSPALKECLIAGLLCNDSHLEKKDDRWQVFGDPTEGALVAVASKVGLTRTDIEQKMPRLDAIPFESEFQYMITFKLKSMVTLFASGVTNDCSRIACKFSFKCDQLI